MVFVLIPAGEFMMGSSEDDPARGRDEGPVHGVTISRPFYLGKYEVTQAQFHAVMGGNPSYFSGDDLPVESVSWHEAVEFCQKLSLMSGHRYRLPTEAEWEYACRAGSSSIFYWGDEMDGSFAWYRENSEGRTHPIGQKEPNAWGLYDMCGNAEEWCSDWYSESYNSSAHEVDPQGPPDGELRARRGGCWEHPEGCLRSGNRYYFNPDETSRQIGFRVVREY